LRIRLHISTPENIPAILELVNKKIKSSILTGAVYNFQIDTYKRELERYDVASIEQAEEIFSTCSYSVCSILQKLIPYENENLRTVVGVLYVYRLINAFPLLPDEKSKLLNANFRYFSAEFNMHLNDQLKDALSDFYRKNQKTIDVLISKEEPWQYLSEQFMREKELRYILKVCGALEASVKKIYQMLIQKRADKDMSSVSFSLISSYVHMAVNRFFKENQRFMELRMYYFLDKYHISQHARAAQQ
jgi:thiopeptide-type bacteriocin biosynthesis protein